MCGNGDCRPLTPMVFGPAVDERRRQEFERSMRDFEKWARDRGIGIPEVTEPNGYCGPSPFVPVTERMPEPCDCCGAIHPKKNLGQRLRALP